MRIDAHSHGMHAERNAQGVLCQPLMLAWKPADGTPEDLIRQHRACGLERVLVVDPPEVAFELKRIFGDFVIPAPQVCMEKSTPVEIESLFERGARGIKFIAPMHSYGDNRYLPLYKVIRDHGGLAVFHTGFLGCGLFGPGALLDREDHVDITHMRPAAIDRIARVFPDLNILMAHFGNPWWEETWTVLHSHKNIYADFSGGTARLKSLSMWTEMFAPNGRLDTATVSKLCFASDDSHFFPNMRTYLDVIEFYERFYEALNLPAEIRGKIDRENARTLLKV